MASKNNASKVQSSGFIFQAVLVALIIVFGLYFVLSHDVPENPESTKDPQKARALAVSLISRSENIERAITRLTGLDQIDFSTLTIDILEQKGLLRSGFLPPLENYPKSSWTFQEMSFAIGKYNRPFFALLLAPNLPPIVCEQINQELFGVTDILSLTQAGQSGLSLNATPADLARVNSIRMGCYNFNPERGTLYSNTFIRFLPRLDY